MSAPAVCWARDPHDGRLHACEPADVLLATSRGHAECLCGHQLPVDVGLEDGPSGALCLPCVIGVTAEMDDPGRMGAAL